MSEDHPSVKKVMKNFRLSELINNDRFIRYSILSLCGIVLLVIGLLARNYYESIMPKDLQSQQLSSQSVLLTISMPSNQAELGEPTPGYSTQILHISDYAEALISVDDLNQIRDIWSQETSKILNYSEKEYNLTEATGVSFVSNSGDFKLSIEMYRFVNDSRMALKVSQTLKDIYLQDLSYQNSYMACPVVVNESSWILTTETNREFLLGKAVGYNFISMRISSDGYIDVQAAVEFLCQIVEKQVNALQASGF